MSRTMALRPGVFALRDLSAALRVLRGEFFEGRWGRPAHWCAEIGMAPTQAILDEDMAGFDLQIVENLFQAAADLPRAERSRYLDQACPVDAALRRHVESLL